MNSIIFTTTKSAIAMVGELELECLAEVSPHWGGYGNAFIWALWLENCCTLPSNKIKFYIFFWFLELIKNWFCIILSIFSELNTVLNSATYYFFKYKVFVA